MSDPELADKRSAVRFPASRLELALPLSADLVLTRLASVPTSDWELGLLLRGEPRPGVLVSLRGERFCLRNSFGLPRYHDVRAYGAVRAMDPLRSTITVEFRKSTISKWAVRAMWLVTIVVVGGAILSATQQPVFIIFAGFSALVGGLLIWNSRERTEDRDRLRTFLTRMFPESVGTRFEPLASRRESP